jgi:hypothetical protein
MATKFAGICGEEVLIVGTAAVDQTETTH